MPLNCIVVDDEPHALKLVKSYVERTAQLELIGAFADPMKALASAQENDVKLLFLDIEMPDLTGIQLSRLLPQDCRVVFTTAYEQYAIESYRVDALDYLLKPFAYEEFLLAVNKAHAYFQLQAQVSSHEPFMFVRADYKLHKVFYDSLLYVENMREYVRFFLADGTRLMSLMSLKSLEESLPQQFMKVHRSYIVNLDNITTIERNRIVFGKEHVPVADSYREPFFAYLKSRSVD